MDPPVSLVKRCSFSLFNNLWNTRLQERSNCEHNCHNYCHESIAKIIAILTDSNGFKHIEFLEDPAKTREGELFPNQRTVNPKMLTIGGERCPVGLFKVYFSKRPDDMRNSGRVNLTLKRSFYK